MKMKRSFAKVIGLIMIAGLLCFNVGNAAGAPAPDASKPIVIGGVLPMSLGDVGFLIEKGAELAVIHANESGGVLGRKVEMFVEDDAGKPDVGIKALKLVLERNPDVILGPNHSAVVLAQTDMIREYAHPQLVPSLMIALYRNNNPWLFGTRPANPASAIALGTWALEQGYRDFGIISDVGAWPVEYKDEFIKYVKTQEPGATFAEEFFVYGDRDMTAQLNKLKDKECLLISAYISDVGALAPQIKRMGYKGQVICTSSLSAPYLMDMSGDYLDGFVGETSYVVGYSNSPKNQAFEAEFKERYGMPTTEMAVAIYDGVSMYLSAVKSAGTTEPAAVREEMLKIKEHDGLQGRLAYFKTGEVRNRVLLFRIKGKQYEIIKEVMPDYNPDA